MQNSSFDVAATTVFHCYVLLHTFIGNIAAYNVRIPTCKSDLDYRRTGLSCVVTVSTMCWISSHYMLATFAL